MKRLLLAVLVSIFVLSLCGLAAATNGDNLIGIGPIARSMGGVGIAAPQDAISAVFANPAAMCFGPYCPGSEFNFAGSVFMPTAKARIAGPSPLGPFDTGWHTSDSNVFVIPAIGLSTPITPNLRFGLAAYGVSGLGVDYKETINLGGQTIFTNLQIMKFAPNLAYMINPNFSIGASVHIDYGALDLDNGTSTGYTAGAQLGAIYKSGPISIGSTYITPQEINHKRVADLNGDGTLDNLKLESPQIAGLGVSFEPIQNILLLEADGKWINWGDAKGYKDFGWRDQWALAVGAQYKPMPKLALRAGLNYANNPVKTNTLVPANFNFEVFRVTGFPAIVTTHATVGAGYQISKAFSLDLGYTHAFKRTITETNPNFAGPGVPATIQASLSEDSIDFGLTWRF